MNHLVRTTHHDTSALEMFCGLTRELPTDKIPGAPVCTNCLVAALEAVDKRLAGDLDRLARVAVEDARADFRKVLGWVDDITLRLERLERKGKKGGKR